MEEKNLKKHNSLWSVSSSWGLFSGFYRQRGFTLVELLVVVGITSLLIAAVLMTLNPFSQIQKSNDVKRKAELSQIQKALETYFQDIGKYPASSANYRIVRIDGTVADWGQQWSPYMVVLPKDPIKTKNYVYYSTSNGQSYWLYASLDFSADRQLCKSDGSACSSLSTNGIASNSCGGVCNFGVSSSNVSP